MAEDSDGARVSAKSIKIPTDFDVGGCGCCCGWS